MANTKELKKRLKSIKGIEKITQAMKMVATARVKKFQTLAQDAAPYSEYIQRMIKGLALNTTDIECPFFEKSKTNDKVLYIVMGADGGMCGSFNANVMNKVMERIKRRVEADHQVYVICVGKKCKNYFDLVVKKYPKVKIIYSLTDYGANIKEEEIYSIAEKAKNMFLAGEVDVVRIIYAKYKNAMSQIPTAINYLPVDKYTESVVKGEDRKNRENDYSTQIFDEAHGGVLHQSIHNISEIEFEPNVDTILNAVIAKYLNNVVYHSVIESMASEFGAKMTAMTAANQNAQDIIGELSREFNKIRQSTITNELIDIVNGANSLN